MSKIIAVAIHKGGVAKTTSVSALASIFAAGGNKVLMVDLDAQASLTYSYFNPGGGLPERFLYQAIRERKNIPQIQINENLFIAPSGLEMCMVEREMNYSRRSEFILDDLLRPVRNKYDVILIDCPPNLGILTTNAVACCDRIVVPMIADPFSYYGLKMFEQFCDECRNRDGLNPNAQIHDIFFTLHNPQPRLTRSIEKQIREAFGDKVLNTTIHRNIAVSETIFSYQSLIEYNPESRAAQDYIQLASELFGRIWGNQQ